MCDIKLKAMNGQIRKTNKQKLRHRKQYGGYQRERGWGASKGKLKVSDKKKTLWFNLKCSNLR